ncbi:MAG: Flp pilus assembly protein CpaB [Dasania sp.]|jgi:Flp pilus assembly protein CpaB
MVRRKKSLVGPIVAVVVAGSVGMFLLSMVNSKETKAVVQPVKPIIKQAPTVKVLTAKDDILIGSKITSNSFMWRAWPESLLSPQYITKNEDPKLIESLSGGIVKIPMVKGEPVIASKIISPGDRGAMAVLLRKGMRAISVPISVVSSAGGFILPGDRVDIIHTATITQDNFFQPTVNQRGGGNNIQQAKLQEYIRLKKRSIIGSRNKVLADNKNITVDATVDITEADNMLVHDLENEKELLVANGRQFSELLLENVRILAIDQSVNQTVQNNKGGRGRRGGKSQKEDDPQGTSSIIGASATLEVTPEQAKILAWSVSSGKLTLSLRAFDGTNATDDSTIPITRTSFAWPIDDIIGGEMSSEDDLSTNTLQIMRNGRVSVLNPLRAPNQHSDQNSGGINVLRK